MPVPGVGVPTMPWRSFQLDFRDGMLDSPFFAH